jgi:hypothetical protein
VKFFTITCKEEKKKVLIFHISYFRKLRKMQDHSNLGFSARHFENVKDLMEESRLSLLIKATNAMVQWSKHLYVHIMEKAGIP